LFCNWKKKILQTTGVFGDLAPAKMVTIQQVGEAAALELVIQK